MQLPRGYWQPNGLTKHIAPRPKTLIDCETVIDVGAGLRPFQWYTPKRHICVEPYEPYCERLRAAGFEVVTETAVVALAHLTADAIYMLDVIEHMTKEDATAVIELALKAAKRQVVVYTPHGFMPQEVDHWGLGGHFWQKHRSGWLPREFPGWSIDLYYAPKRKAPEGFFATKTLLAV